MIPFHRLLIASAIVFCACFAAWAAWGYHRSHQGGLLALALVFAAFAAGLTYYLRHLRRFLGR